MVSAILLFATAYVIGAVTGPRLVAWGRRQVEECVAVLLLTSFPLFILALVAVAGGLLVLAWAGSLVAVLGLSAGLAAGVDAALQTEAGRQLPAAWRETLPGVTFAAVPLAFAAWCLWSDLTAGLKRRWERLFGARAATEPAVLSAVAEDADRDPAPPVGTWLGCAYEPSYGDHDDNADAEEAWGAGCLYLMDDGLEQGLAAAYDNELVASWEDATDAFYDGEPEVGPEGALDGAFDEEAGASPDGAFDEAPEASPAGASDARDGEPEARPDDAHDEGPAAGGAPGAETGSPISAMGSPFSTWPGPGAPDAELPPWARLVREAALAGRITPQSPPSVVAFHLDREPSFEAYVAGCIRRCGDAEAGVEEALRGVFHLVVLAHLERSWHLPDADGLGWP